MFERPRRPRDPEPHLGRDRQAARRAHHEIFTQGHWLIAASLAEQIAGAALRWLEEALGQARGQAA
jgi:hypothetical protein